MDAAAVRAEVGKLVNPPELDDSEFYERYRAALQKPEVIVAHSNVRKAVAALPEPEPEDLAEVMRVRHKWAERNRHRLR